MIKLGAKKDGNITYKCTVKLLDDNDLLECDFQSYYKGRHLVDFVYRHLNLVETDYFGLRYVDQNKQRHWLDPNRNILRQIKGMNPVLFCFRIKFYPSDPMKLKEEISRYYLFLQLRRDLLHGRLYCTQADAAILGAYIIQADYGDADEDELDTNYVSDYKLFLKQTSKLEEKIIENHLNLRGLSPSEAETCFLKKASSMDTYGVDPYSVKNQEGTQIFLGLGHDGIMTFEGPKKTHHYHWAEIQKLNYEGKMFIIHWFIMEKKNTVGFKCSSATTCKSLWRSAVEQRLFYTMDSSNKQGTVVTGGSFFSRGSKFRFQGRCAKEVVEESSGISREPPEVKRISLRIIGRSASLPTTPADSTTYDSTDSGISPFGALEPLPEDAETNGNVVNGEKYKEGEHPYNPEFCSSSPSGYSRSTVDGDAVLEVDASKDFVFSKDGNENQGRKMCNCNRGRREGDTTTSTESLGPLAESGEENHLKGVFPNRRRLGKHGREAGTKAGLDKNSLDVSAHKSWLNIIGSHLKSQSSFRSNAVNFSRVFLITFVSLIFLFLLFTVVLFETDTSFLDALRSSREMILFKLEYYDPVKTYLSEIISSQ